MLRLETQKKFSNFPRFRSFYPWSFAPQQNVKHQTFKHNNRGAEKMTSS